MLQNKTFNFLKHAKLFYVISAAIVAVAVLVTVFFGLEVDIEFKGGTVSNYSYTGELSLSDVQAAVKEAIGYSSKVRSVENAVTGKTNLNISISEDISSDEQAKMTDTLAKKFAANQVKLTDASSVNPMNGRSFFIKCLLAVALAAVLMVIYIAIRFRKIGGWSAGTTAVIALVHDLIVVYAAYAIFRIEIGGNFMAVMLTILGYSINDTIVVFDRVRENKNIYGKKLPVAENVNRSLNQVLSRAINTTLTTLIALAVVVIVSLMYDITSMFDFIFPMAIGLISGVYSSLCLAPNIWVLWQQHSEKKKKKR